jgi:hypothetical protein
MEIKNLQKKLDENNKEISNLNKDLANYLKNISNINNELIKSLDNGEIKILNEKKNQLLTNKIETSLKITELKIENLKISKTIKDLKNNDYLLADGKFNWTKTFNIKNKPAGKWHISVKAQDDMNNYSREEAININIDPKSDIPTLTVINPQANGRVTNNLRIVGTAYDDDEVKEIIIYLDKETDERKASGKDFWYYDLDTSNLEDGIHSIKVKVSDINGVSSKEIIVPFRLDRMSPILSIENTPKELTVSGKINISGKATDKNGIKSVEYSTNERISFNKASSLKLDKNNTVASWGVNLNSEDLVDGMQTIWIKAVDTTGSESYESLTFVIDHRIPIIKIQYPKDKEKVDGKFRVFGFADDNVGIKKITFSIKGAGPLEKPQEVKMMPGNPFWSYDVDISNLKNGTYQLIAAVQDVSGNTTTTSINVEKDGNLDKPKLVLKSLKKGDRVSSTLNLFAKVYDDDANKEVNIKIYKKGNNTTVYEDTVPAKYSLIKDINLTDYNQFTEGEYTVDLTPVDINGISGDKVTESFWIERNFPRFDLKSINKWAGKSFNSKIDFNFNIIKFGELKSLKYSIIDPSNYTEIIKPSDIRFKKSKESGIYETENAGFELSKNKNIPDGFVLIKLDATDISNNTASLLVPVIIDTKMPVISAPKIDNAKGMTQDESLSINDNFILKSINVNISSTDKKFATVNLTKDDIGSLKEIDLKAKDETGKLNEYTLNIEASDIAGNSVKSSLKINFKDPKQDSYKIAITASTNDNTVYSNIPLVFKLQDDLGLETLDSTIFCFMPSTYNNPLLNYEKIKKQPEIVDEVNGIFVYKFSDEEKSGMKSGINKANLTFNSTAGGKQAQNVTISVNLLNDISDPVSGIIWPLPYLPFNNNFTLYGKASDDSGLIAVKYITDDNLPQEIAITDFEKNILGKINSNEDKKTINDSYYKDKTNYKLKNNLEGTNLLDLCDIFDSLGYQLNFQEAKINASKSANTTMIPYIDPLLKGKTRSLADFAGEQKINISQNDNIYEFNVNISNMKEGEHAVYIKINDPSGRLLVKKGIFIIDKTPPEVNAWSLKPQVVFENIDKKKEDEKKPVTKKKITTSKDKNNKNNNEKTEIQDDSQINENTNTGKRDKVNGEITLRGEAKDNNYISNVLIMYNGKNITADGAKIWESAYNLNGIKDVVAKEGEETPYTINISAVDLAGNITNIGKDIIIDKTEDIPKIFIQKPAVENQRFNGDVAVSGIAIDDDIVDYIEFRLDYNSNYSDSKTGGWEKIDFDKVTGAWFKNIPNESLKSGIHTIEVQATDIYGAKSKIKKISFHLDMENPTINIGSPRTGQYLSGETVIIGKSTDPNGIDSVKISTNYGWSFVQAEGNESWRYYFDSKSVPDGAMRVLIKSTDKAGSEGFSFALYNIDNTPPEINILLPKDGMKINNKFRIIGRARDNIGIDSVRIYINTDEIIKSKDADQDGYVPVIGKEAWYYDLDVTNWNTEKTYQLIAVVKDLAGNTSEKSMNFTVDPKSDIPSVEVIQPQPGQHLTGEVINFFGTAYDDDGIDSVYIKIDDEKEVQVKGTNTWQYTLPTVNLSPGAHKVTFYSIEKTTEGSKTQKKSGPISRIFYYDEAGPVITVDSHINGAPIEHRPWMYGSATYFENNLILKIKRKIQETKYEQFKVKYRRTPELIPDVDKIPVSKSEVDNEMAKYLRNNKIKAVYLSLDNGKTFIKNRWGILPKWKMRLQTQLLDNGNHTIQIKTVSSNNKESIQYFRAIIDRNIPEVMIDKPRENSKYNDSLYVRGSANDNGNIERVEIALKRWDKNLGKIPKFVQGIYVWLQAFSGPWISGGFGLTFFEDVVRIEGLFGWTPTRSNLKDLGMDPDNVPDGILRTSKTSTGYNPRYSGFTTGGKLLARIIEIPFEFFGGEDLKDLSITISIGCGFYWFTGFGGATAETDNSYYEARHPENPKYLPLEDGKVIGGFMYQIDLIRIERLGGFRKFAIYFENAFYFVASEIEGGLVPQFGFGVRSAFF